MPPPSAPRRRRLRLKTTVTDVCLAMDDKVGTGGQGMDPALAVPFAEALADYADDTDQILTSVNVDHIRADTQNTSPLQGPGWRAHARPGGFTAPCRAETVGQPCRLTQLEMQSQDMTRSWAQALELRAGMRGSLPDESRCSALAARTEALDNLGATHV
ncbi:hypothetical protein AB0C13_04295 [Streptomyces sp. NPDC049099]|uniref:hypothetical protein n=1 Tax=Streptomyces sp. NPDC049099 TaxID=3155768 RepID=UPI003418A56A